MITNCRARFPQSENAFVSFDDYIARAEKEEYLHPEKARYCDAESLLMSDFFAACLAVCLLLSTKAWEEVEMQEKEENANELEKESKSSIGGSEPLCLLRREHLSPVRRKNLTS